LNAKIDLAYDSHVHFFGVGIPAVQWRIFEHETSLKLPTHLSDQKLIKGFGWSNKMPLTEFTKLTKAHPDKEFCLSYFDGHSSFLSDNLVHRLKLKSEKYKALETGIIIGEKERDEAFKHMPHDNDLELRKMALFAQDVFIKNGFNRVRHMTAREDHWHCLRKLESEGLLKIKIEVFFSEFMGQTMNEAINSFNNFFEQSSETLKASGVKLFYDGAFGSNTAFTSLKGSARPHCSKDILKLKMFEIYTRTESPIAVHTIGDLALEDAISAYHELEQENDLPALHLEHAPIFSNKTLSLLKKQKLNCIFHFQPSHWINDHIWYSEHRDRLQEHEIYPFKFLFKNGYEFHFGSDAPVVECSKDATLTGLQMIEDDRLKKSSSKF